MSRPYSIHFASDAERLAAYRNVHEVWGQGLPMPEFLERRLRSVRHNRAQWWVLTVGDEVISSLGNHPLEFFCRGRIHSGFGIGSVHTLPAHRQKGYAEALCREVLRESAARGDHLALLYCDIAPAYYERLGFRVCPAFEFRCDRLRELAADGSQAELEPFVPQAHLEELDDWYQRCCSLRDVFVWRSGDYWRYSLLNGPDDLFFRIRGPGGVPSGYLRLAERVAELELIEFMLPERQGDLETSVHRAVASLALARGYQALAGWLPPDAAHPPESVVAPRKRRIPMLCALGDNVSLNDTILQQCHFCYSDHF